MQASDLSIGLEFDLTADPKSFTVTDTFDYDTLLGYSNVLGNVKATAPDGVVFHNNISLVTPDIDISSSTTSDAYPLSLDSDGNPKAGSYKFQYTATVQDEVLRAAIVTNNSGAKTFVLNGNYLSALATGSNFLVNDGSDVPITLDGTPTYSTGTGQTTVTINETLGVLSVNAYFQYELTSTYVKEFTVAYEYETPDICINIEFDQCCTLITFTDETAYPEGSTVTRLHTVRYPLSSPAKANLTSPLQSFPSSPAWTGTYTDLFTADIEYVSGILTVIDEASNTKELKVSTDASSCQVAACINNVALKYNSQLTSAPAQAQITGKYLLNAVALVTAYNLAIKCGNADDATDYLGKIKEIAETCGCDCDCEDCSDGTSTQVVGCCDNVAFTTNTVVLDSPDSSITVTSDTVGDTTTFSIIVNQAQLGTFVSTYVGTLSINALSDVDTASVPPTTGQSLIWNGTVWVPGIPSMALKNLTDVFDSLAPSDNDVLYYQNSSGLWKSIQLTLNFLSDVTLTGTATGQIIKYNGSVFVNVDNTLALLSDVDLTGLATNDILKWNGTDWLCVDNFLSLLTDVNTTGIADGSALEWDTGTSKWIVFTPKKTFASLDDTNIDDAVPLNGNDRVRYISATGWTNEPIPSPTNVGTVFASGFTSAVSGFRAFSYIIDPLTTQSIITGSISNGNGAVAGPVLVATLPIGQRPVATIPFICTVGIGGANAFATGDITSSGAITIYEYSAPATGIMTSGIPTGDIVFSVPILYYIPV